jgi:hypothetical protein
MAKFALGSISTMASLNSQIQIPGTLPHLGSRLVVTWPFFILLLSFIVVAHFIIFAWTSLHIKRGSYRVWFVSI